MEIVNEGQRADRIRAPPSRPSWFFVHAAGVAAVANTGKVVLPWFACFESFLKRRGCWSSGVAVTPRLVPPSSTNTNTNGIKWKVCVSAVDPELFPACVAAGAEMVELGNFDCFYDQVKREISMVCLPSVARVQLPCLTHFVSLQIFRCPSPVSACVSGAILGMFLCFYQRPAFRSAQNSDGLRRI